MTPNLEGGQSIGHPQTIAPPSRIGRRWSGDDCRVVLVSMPFASTSRPSLQLGLLAEIARRRGFPTDTVHAMLDLAALLGVARYERLATYRGRSVGDWLFSVEAFGASVPDPVGRFVADFAEEVGALGADLFDANDLLAWRRDAVPRFLDDLVVERDWSRYDVVGFTSTFEQTCASIALARRLRVAWPHLRIVLGGANMEHDMGQGWAQSLEGIVDVIVSGAADLSFPRLLEAFASGSDPATVPGVLVVGEPMGSLVPPPAVDLDDQPVPDYGEYFERAQRLGLLAPTARYEIDLPFESARGCWWGERRHCTFCGLNGATMAFRSKSPKRLRDELHELATRHRSYRFEAVDNILDPRYLDELFPDLVDEAVTYEFFYEVKANLSREDLRRLRRAGVRRIQPGIESLSSHVLGLMQKGTRAATNLNLLRWARHLGLDVSWNILWGFPGERTQDYEQQAELIPRLAHLQPPRGWGRLWMERFSPMFHDRERFPVAHLEPERSLRQVLPRSVPLDRVAYFFDYRFEDALDDEHYLGLADACTTWAAAWQRPERPTLTWWHTPGRVQIDDFRDTGKEGVFTFEGLDAELYLACAQQPRTVRQLCEDGVDASPQEIEESLEHFDSLGLVARDGNLFVALALPAAAEVVA